jgi:large subunit ribosomal protein L23
MANPYDIVIRPWITEKTTDLYERQGVYTFVVQRQATKPQIKAAVEHLFGVKVAKVWTQNVRGKRRRVGTHVGRRPHWKKAMVQLEPGHTIELFEGV